MRSEGEIIDERLGAHVRRSRDAPGTKQFFQARSAYIND
jgi:hypothetical protein